MRAIAVLALLLPAPALADQILASSRISAVTVFPEGAQVTREITFKADAGPHDLLITDLPAATEPGLIRLAAPDVQLGAFALRTDRLPPRSEDLTPAQKSAQDAVAAARIKVQAAQGLIDAIHAKMDAAEAQAAFLRGVKAEGGAITADALRGMAQMIGTEVLAAREAGLAAAAELPAAEKGLTEAQEALGKAEAAEQALSRSAEDYAALSVSITMPAKGEGHLTVTHFVADATWQPVYDLMLTRKDTPSLTIARGVLVSQNSGEDWGGVALTLSTAQPSSQSAPSGLWPDLRRIEDKQQMAKSGAAIVNDYAEPAPVAMAEPIADTAHAVLQGDVVVYNYPKPVDVANGVEDLRLALDEIKLLPKVEARAVPRYDHTAFVLASFTNSSGEILLPGQAFLLREGVLVGGMYLDSIAPGAKAEVPFGAIEGLRLTRDMPQRTEGDTGILTSSSQIEETSVLKVENLTDEAWPVRLMDQVPYSEQEDLQISYSANPEPTETDVNGQRGILAWDFTLTPGATRTITLNHVMNWPEDKVLQ